MAYTDKHRVINAMWTNVVSRDPECGWSDYADFRMWSEPRWAERSVLAKLDERLPWGPDNAEWVGGHDPDAWTPQWGGAYRKAPMPESNPCGGCRLAKRCTKWCPSRAKWWDKKMEEVRRLVG